VSVVGKDPLYKQSTSILFSQFNTLITERFLGYESLYHITVFYTSRYPSLLNNKGCSHLFTSYQWCYIFRSVFMQEKRS